MNSCGLRFQGKTLLGVFYNPPATGTDYLCRLRNSLALIADSCSIVLCGDFNIPNVNWDSSVPTVSSPKASLLCDIALSSSLYQLFPEATRCNNTLDLLFTNNTDKVKDVAVIDGILRSDHDGIHFNVSITSP